MAAAAGSPSSSSSSSTRTTTTTTTNPNPNNSNPNPIQSWWESISKARSTILKLSSLLSLPSLSSLADSDRPASSLLSSSDAYSAVSFSLSAPSSGSGDDPLCQWLYETFHSSDPDLKLVVLSFVPLLVNSYLSRLISSPYSSLSGFESVILTIYQSETRSRGGKPVLISVPDLLQPSLYHLPASPGTRSSVSPAKPKVGILSPPLEPQVAVKSTKRAGIVGVVLDCYYKKISQMPVKSKVDFCEFVICWAGQDCSCRYEIDEETNSNSNSSCLSNFEEEDASKSNGNCDGISYKGCRIPLPWELLQPVIRILGHCLLAPRNVEEVRNAASAAVRSVYARGLHELNPQTILASRSLIRLDNSARKREGDTVGMSAVGGMALNPTTPRKPKKPEVLLVSK